MAKTLAAFVLPLVIGRAVEFVLGTQVGTRLAEAMNNPTIATLEGRRVVRKYSSAAAAIAVGASFTLGRRPASAGIPRRSREETVGMLAEALLSAGALFKLASDYMHDQQAVRRRQRISA